MELSEEVEFDEDEIYAYLYDENGLEIGFSVIDEGGDECEYFYTKDEIRRTNDATRKQDMENVERVKKDLNKMYHENKDVIDGVKDAISDINEMFKGITK